MSPLAHRCPLVLAPPWGQPACLDPPAPPSAQGSPLPSNHPAGWTCSESPLIAAGLSPGPAPASRLCSRVLRPEALLLPPLRPRLESGGGPCGLESGHIPCGLESGHIPCGLEASSSASRAWSPRSMELSLGPWCQV